MHFITYPVYIQLNYAEIISENTSILYLFVYIYKNYADVYVCI